MLERIWHGAVSSIATYSTPKSSPTSNTMTTTTMYIENNTTSKKKSRSTTKPKVGRRFFQHDTRNNTDCFSYANGRRRAAATFTEIAKRQYVNDSDLESEPRLQSVISIDPRLRPTNRRNTAMMDHIATDIVNTKLRKKLFKIQRKLRLQTVALKQQQYATSSAVTTGCGGATLAPSVGCCCSCACSAVAKTSTGESDAVHVHHTASHHHPLARQIVQQRIPTALYECSSMLCQGDDKGRIMMDAVGVGRLPPIRVQGLRSVVR